MKIRTARRADSEALCSICLKTGDAGADATTLYHDPDLLGLIYAAPYVAVRGGFGFVAEDEEGVCGYVVGTADTTAFEAALDEDWWPDLKARFPAQRIAHGKGMQDGARIRHIHQPPRTPEELLADYPAHIHMNVLPRTQGKGAGSRLLSLFLDELKNRSATGVHAGVAPSNKAGLAFWTNKGLGIVRDDRPATIWCGMRL